MNGQVGTPVLEGWWLVDVIVEVKRIASYGGGGGVVVDCVTVWGGTTPHVMLWYVT